MLEATRAMLNNPADQIRLLLALCTYADTHTYGPGGLAADAAIVGQTMAVICRRCALTSLALATAAYQPVSYEDAIAMRDQIAAALDVEITAAGDAGDDNSYIALKNVRAAVIQDLTARAAALPLVITLTLPSNLSALVVAYRVYRDASRADQVAAEAGVPHPAFLPTTIQVLAS
jgi:prophage DNA circulation protein